MNRPLILTDPTGLQAGNEKRSVTVEASDVRPTISQAVSSEDGILKETNERIRITVSSQVVRKLNELGENVERLAVSQRENYEAATEYGAAAINQADYSSIASEVTAAALHPAIALSLSIDNPIQNETPQSVAYKYTDSMGILNIPGTTNATQIGGGVAPEGIGPSGSVVVEQNFSIGDGASAFQSAANRQQLEINALATDGAAQRFGQANGTGGQITYRIYNSDGTLGSKVHVGNGAVYLANRYKQRVAEAQAAAAENPYMR